MPLQHDDKKNPSPYVYAKAEEDRPFLHASKKGNFQTFTIPAVVLDIPEHQELGRELVRAFRTDGLLQFNMDDAMMVASQQALAANRDFCKLPLEEKAQHVSPLTYSGYIRSGEEQTDGKSDASEIFTVTPDITEEDERSGNWPCHGPCPWPNTAYRTAMKTYMTEIGKVGDRAADLISLGLGLKLGAIAEYCKDGWHHMRVLRFPAAGSTKFERGIGAHTDYGLLVLAAQDEVGGLWIRKPVQGELRLHNWLDGHSMAGMFENEEPWTFVQPVANVLTCFPGDMFQLLTNGYLLSTPHKVALHATKERYALAYFHEPKFTSSLRTLPEFANEGEKEHSIHYGRHFTNMFMRCYTDRCTTQRLVDLGFPAKLSSLLSTSC